jgi:hypothetical protein
MIARDGDCSSRTAAVAWVEPAAEPQNRRQPDGVGTGVLRLAADKASDDAGRAALRLPARRTPARRCPNLRL